MREKTLCIMCQLRIKVYNTSILKGVYAQIWLNHIQYYILSSFQFMWYNLTWDEVKNLISNCSILKFSWTSTKKERFLKLLNHIFKLKFKN